MVCLHPSFSTTHWWVSYNPPFLGSHPRSCSVTPAFLCRWQPSYTSWQRGDPRERPCLGCWTCSSIRSPWLMAWHAQLPLGSGNALVSQRRGKDTGERNYGLLFCCWTDLHYQAEDSMKSCITHAILQWTQSLGRLLCEVLNAPSFLACFTVFNVDDLMWEVVRLPL